MRLALAAILLSASATAHAQARLCSADIVTLGDASSAVRAACGEPVGTRTYCAAELTIDRPGSTPQPSINTPCREIVEWTYRSVSGEPTTRLAFEAGRLRSIDDDRSVTTPAQR